MHIYNDGLYNDGFTFNSPTEKKKDAFERLSEGEIEKIRTILYIMDRFTISRRLIMNLPNKSLPCRRHTSLSLARKSLLPCGNQQGHQESVLELNCRLSFCWKKEIRGLVRVFSKLRKKIRGCVWLIIYNSQT